LQRPSNALIIQPDGIDTLTVRRHIKQRVYDLHAIVLKMVEALSSPARRLPAYAKDAYKSVADNLNPEPPESYPSRVLQLQLLWNGRPVNLAAGTSCCGCDHHSLPLLALVLEEHHRMLYISPSFRTMQSSVNCIRAQLLLTYSYTATRYRWSIVVMAPQDSRSHGSLCQCRRRSASLFSDANSRPL
jgi:hypothetical protein